MDVCNEIKYIILSYLDTDDIIILMKYDDEFRCAFKKFNKILPNTLEERLALLGEQVRFKIVDLYY